MLPAQTDPTRSSGTLQNFMSVEKTRLIRFDQPVQNGTRVDFLLRSPSRA